MGARYVAFTIADDGSLHDKRVWAEVPGRGPDGCTLDADGAIWVADAGGGGCFRVAEGGEVLDHVEASQPVFACALGGPERRTLHLITAPGFGSDRAGQGEGKVEVVDVDVPGAGWP
jgi:sugar lactone lactonase YvrE